MKTPQKKPLNPKKVIALADTFEAADIADILGVSQSVVDRILADHGLGRETWEVWCNRTGRRFVSRSRRGAYRLAQLHGLTDWDWCLAGQGPAQNTPVEPF